MQTRINIVLEPTTISTSLVKRHEYDIRSATGLRFQAEPTGTHFTIWADYHQMAIVLHEALDLLKTQFPPDAQL